MNRRRTCRFIVAVVLALACGACKANRVARKECPTPADLKINTRDLVDAAAQGEFDHLVSMDDFYRQADRIRKQAFEAAMKERNPQVPYRQKNVLCLSGGGSFGSFSAGILYGWSCRGDRPEFDVVTGISTGALIAPFAFIGSSKDEEMKRFFTTLTNKDIFKPHYVRGLFNESFADNAPLAEQVDKVLTPEMIDAMAWEHTKGRRLYIGTTAAESKRFVLWDIGAIACRGRPQDRCLIKQILLGSSAIPGFFPPQHITVDVDGACVTERHIDGGVSQAIFMQAPFVDPDHRSKNPNADLAGTNVYCVIAGKLYSDLEKIKPTALAVAGKEISAMIYAQTRGDMQRLFLLSTITGMNYHLASIPIEYDAPTSSTEFKPELTTKMFNEGVRLMCSDTAWRRTPPGVEPGETFNVRTGVCLTHQVRGPLQPGSRGSNSGASFSSEGIPAVPPIK